MYKISVIIPVFNGEKYICNCLDKLQTQRNIEDLEIIVIDDASTDNTPLLLKQYSFVRIFTNKTNMGPSYSRNIGLDNATGKYVTLLDVDDFYREDRLYVMAKFMENHTDCMICSDYNVNVLSTGKVKSIYPSFWFPSFYPKKMTLAQYVRVDCGPLKPMIKLSFLRENQIKYNESIRYSEDFDFYYRIIQKTDSFYILPSRSNFRLIHSGSLSTNRIELYTISLNQTWNYIEPGNRANRELKKRIEKLMNNLYCIKNETHSPRNIFESFKKIENLLLYRLGLLK